MFGHKLFVQKRGIHLIEAVRDGESHVLKYAEGISVILAGFKHVEVILYRFGEDLKYILAMDLKDVELLGLFTEVGVLVHLVINTVQTIHLSVENLGLPRFIKRHRLCEFYQLFALLYLLSTKCCKSLLVFTIFSGRRIVIKRHNIRNIAQFLSADAPLFEKVALFRFFILLFLFGNILCKLNEL